MIIANRDRLATQPGNSASCIMFVEDVLPIALARPYVEQYVPDGTRVRQDNCMRYIYIYIYIYYRGISLDYPHHHTHNNVKQENISMLADFLVQGFGERVREMNWLSDFSKQATLEKVNALTSMVAYPEDILNNDYVNGLYSTVSYTAAITL